MRKKQTSLLRNQASSRKRVALFVAGGITLALLIGGAIFVLSKENKISTETPNSTNNSSQSPEDQTPTTPDTTPDQGSKDPPTESITPNTETPTTPTGAFVSNHRPNLSGSPAPNSMTSTCQTSPGAACTIKFSKGGVVKSLQAQTADSNGYTVWNWSLQDIDLTAGSWEITAVATIGKNSTSSRDVLNLEVAE